MTAVVDYGDTGKIFSPNSALEKEDFPALKAPNKAIVSSRFVNVFVYLLNRQ